MSALLDNFNLNSNFTKAVHVEDFVYYFLKYFEIPDEGNHPKSFASDIEF